MNSCGDLQRSRGVQSRRMVPRLMPLIGVLCVTLAVTRGQAAQKRTLVDPCTTKQTCSECLQTSACAWCAQVDLMMASNTSVHRCGRQQAFDSGELSCAAGLLRTWANQVRLEVDQQLSGAVSAADALDAIQIAPQRVRMTLRVNEPQDLELRFALASNYPIDLYYLMDLSKSMEDDKDKLSTLGKTLADEMRTLTSNFRLGFGSFVDKVVMPYVSTVPQKLFEPCDNCIPPYGYKNQISLTANTSTFEAKVRSAKVSGNLDAPEGGFDAIMQAIVCKKEIAWRSNARRLLVFSTDAGFHYAGDGKLGGVVKPNDGVCHLDAKGSYTHSEMLDYPSVSHINQKVKENSINLIFAVTAEQRDTYDELSSHIEASSAGTLSNDSSNVVELVKNQYKAITSFVEMKDTSSDFVRISYFSSCLGSGPPEKTNRCDGIRIGQRVNFTAKIELLKCPEDPARWNDHIEIRPAGLKESLVIELTMMCQCDCEKPGDPSYVTAADECSGEGDLQCGVCSCHGQRFGALCECSDTDTDGRVGEDRCRPVNSTGPVCHGRGECVCGQCQCSARPNGKEVVTGEFCECDNFSCDRHEKRLCSGEVHGSCVCGKCSCLPDWDGDACQCPASNSSCIAPGDSQACSGNGVCECGQCRCSEGSAGRYSGKYCGDCPTCKGKCDVYRACVECTVFETGEFEVTCLENCGHMLINETDVVEVQDPDERMCLFTDEAGCRYRFVYGYDKSNNPVIRVQPTKQCPTPINILGIVLTLIAAIVVVGMAVLMLWKLLTTIHDRREYAKWDSERKNAKWDTGENPLYKKATSTFKNPAYGGKM